MAWPTEIEWADASWNPVVGCSVLSAGCTNCYAMRLAGVRLDRPGALYHGLTREINGRHVWTGEVRLAPEKTLQTPLSWRAPRAVFVNSMGDLGHEGVTDSMLDDVFAVMALASRHTFFVLTKRPERLGAYLAAVARSGGPALMEAVRRRQSAARSNQEAWIWPLPNVWVGVSVEDQASANARVPLLLDLPAALRFVSYEPALDPVRFSLLRAADTGEIIDALRGQVHGEHETRRIARLRWIIAGGESGADARPMAAQWARDVRDQCAAADVSFFMKQMSGRKPIPADLQIRERPPLMHEQERLI